MKLQIQIQIPSYKNTPMKIQFKQQPRFGSASFLNI